MSVSVSVTRDLAICAALRRQAFVEEQGVPIDVEQDGRDGDAHHLLATLEGCPAGCARILVEGATGRLGRLCVLPRWRGRGVGAALVEGCVAHVHALGLRAAELAALCDAMGLFARRGLAPFGPVFEDAGGKPHQMMRRGL